MACCETQAPRIRCLGCGHDIENQALEVESLIKSSSSIEVFVVVIKRPSSVCVNLVNCAICGMFYISGMRLYNKISEVHCNVPFLYHGLRIFALFRIY